jgi:DNA invertase Pin-like site-specific DNA recombinase
MAGPRTLTGMTKRSASSPTRSPVVRARMVLYIRVSTDEQSNGLDAQRVALEHAGEYQGWKVAELVADEGQSGKDLDRPGLKRALSRISTGRADGLAVTKLDRLSRSVIDAGELADWFDRAGARLVALDMNIDTSTPSGLMILHVISSVAQWERETIAQRTRDGLAALRAKGMPTGRPAVADMPELAARILERRKIGITLQGIADELNADGIPTLRGGSCWRPSSVQSAAGYHRARARHKPAVLPALDRRVG